MNKKEISQIKKEFKEETYKLRINDVFSAYGKVDSKEILFSNVRGFFDFELDEKEILFTNFKKALTGVLDTKLFELDIENDERGKKQQTLLINIKNNDDFKTNCLELSNKIMENYMYEKDAIITIANMTMTFSTSKKKGSEEEDADETERVVKFALCTVNQVSQREKDFVLNIESRDIELSSNLEFAVDMKKPLEGFLFPTLTDGYEDVNKILYIAPKANVINEQFVQEVISCEVKMTSKQEKELFSEALKSSLGTDTNTNELKDIYSELIEIGSKNKDGSFSSKDLARLLKNKGIEESDVFQIEKVISEKTGFSTVDFNVGNVIPNQTTKSVKIKTSNADVSVSGANLEKIKRVKKNGRVCLMIELGENEDIEVEGFNLETE